MSAESTAGKDAIRKREKRDRDRRAALKAKDAERKRLVAAGLRLGYDDKRIAAGLCMPVQLLRDAYGDLLAAGRDGQAMEVTALLAGLAEAGDTRAAVELLRAMEPKQFHPPRADQSIERVPVELIMVFSHEPKAIDKIADTAHSQRLGITFDGSGVVVSGS